MNALAAILICIVAIFGGILFGIGIAADEIADDCQVMGKFRRDERVFICGPAMFNPETGHREGP